METGFEGTLSINSRNRLFYKHHNLLLIQYYLGPKRDHVRICSGSSQQGSLSSPDLLLHPSPSLQPSHPQCFSPLTAAIVFRSILISTSDLWPFIILAWLEQGLWYLHSNAIGVLLRQLGIFNSQDTGPLQPKEYFIIMIKFK